jgi:hypothetical protein
MTQEPSARTTSQAEPRMSSDDPGATTRDVTEKAKDTAGQAVDQAKQTAGQVAAQAKQQATSQLESQKERTVDTLDTVAQALRQTGQHLSQGEQTAVGGYVEQAAERVEKLTDYLRTRDVASLVAETQHFARRNPGLFLGGALALGFIGGRFLKSSGERAMVQPYASSRPSPTFGYTGQRSSENPASYAGDSAVAALRPSGHATYETPARSGTQWQPGVASALEP